MQPISRELSSGMNNINSVNLEIVSHSQLELPFDPTSSSNDDFLEHLLSSVPSSASSFSWADDQPSPGLQGHFDEQSVTDMPSKLRQHQISNGGVKAALMLQQHQFLLFRGLGLANDLLLDHNDVIHGSSFSPASLENDTSVKALFNGSVAQISNQPQQFNHPQEEASPAINQPAGSGSSGAAAGQPRQRVRARRGQATDPHSIAERLRRERIAERMKGLQELVPNANKTDKASMLDEIIDYVKFLQLQVKVLSMSRLGGAAAIAPLVADMSSEGRNRNATDTRSISNNSDGIMVTEHQVAKLLEEDMGSAMQYLQGKGLCLVPISLATAISTSTCHTRNRLNTNNSTNNPILNSETEGPPPRAYLS